MHVSRGIVVMSVLLLAAGVARSDQPPAARCMDGRFVVAPSDARRIADLVGEGPVAAELTARRLTLGSCAPVPAHVKSHRRFTAIRARWRRCLGTRGLRFIGRIPAPACDTLSAVLRGHFPGRRQFTAARAPQPPSEALIATALHDGVIDYPTSLVYRAWTLFHDPRLPAAFDGSGPGGDDALFFAEVRAMADALPPAARASIEPYLLRPDDPRSPFGPSAATRAASAASGPRGGAGATGCSTHWSGVVTPRGHFKIWLCASADSAADDSTRIYVAGLADDLWDAMTPAMGPPRPDDDGGDDRVDVYLLSPNQCRVRDRECLPIPGSAVAAAYPVAPFTSNGRGGQVASGVIVVDRTRIADLAADLAHEFFHVLQFAHNEAARLIDTGQRLGDVPVLDASWFVEASATWAEWWWAPATRRTLHQANFVGRFQAADASLLTTDPPLHPYGAYIWPYFVHQERGAAAVVQAWFDAEPATTPVGIDDAVDAQLPFTTAFRHFAIRNLNVDLSGNPLGTRYVAQDPDNFPDDVPPRQVTDDTSPLVVLPEGSLSQPVGIDPLAAQYDRLLVDPGVEGLEIDFGGVTPAAALDVDAVVDVGGTWRRVPASGGRLAFCRLRPEEAVDQLYLVLANHDRTRAAHGGPGPAVAGTYDVTTGPCAVTSTTTTSPTSTSLAPGCSDRDRWHARLEIDESGVRPSRVVRTVREVDGHGGVRGGYTVHETSQLDDGSTIERDSSGAGFYIGGGPVRACGDDGSLLWADDGTALTFSTTCALGGNLTQLETARTRLVCDNCLCVVFAEDHHGGWRCCPAVPDPLVCQGAWRLTTGGACP